MTADEDGYGPRLPGLPKEIPAGKLIVVEGADGSGRTDRGRAAEGMARSGRARGRGIRACIAPTS